MDKSNLCICGPAVFLSCHLLPGYRGTGTRKGPEVAHWELLGSAPSAGVMTSAGSWAGEEWWDCLWFMMAKHDNPKPQLSVSLLMMKIFAQNMLKMRVCDPSAAQWEHNSRAEFNKGLYSLPKWLPKPLFAALFGTDQFNQSEKYLWLSCSALITLAR